MKGYWVEEVRARERARERERLLDEDEDGSSRRADRGERHYCDAVAKLCGSSTILMRKKLSMLRSMSTSAGVTMLSTMPPLLCPVAQAMLHA